MANFSSLKQAIQNYIKENGNKEITGNLLQEILLSMVVTMGDNAINSLTTVVNELNTILHNVDAEPTKNSDNLVRSGGVWSGINREALRAFNAETFEARFNSSNNRVEFFNQSGDMLYWYDASAFVVSGLVVDVYIDGDNLVFVIDTQDGEKTIEVPLTDIFNPNNYYTKTQIDNMMTAIGQLYDGAEYRGFITPNSPAETKVGVKMVCFATEAGLYANYLDDDGNSIEVPVRGIWVFERGVDEVGWTAYSLLEIDKVYAPAQASGMGRVVLQKNMVNGVNTLTQDMFYKGEVGSRVPNTNTIFVIEYDFTLGENITVPANCVLEFDGGSLNNGSITYNKTYIRGDFKSSNCVISGTVANEVSLSRWFNVVSSDELDNTQAINNFVKSAKNLILEFGSYLITDTIKIPSNTIFDGSWAQIKINADNIVGLQYEEVSSNPTIDTVLKNIKIRSSNNGITAIKYGEWIYFNYLYNFDIDISGENAIGIELTNNFNTIIRDGRIIGYYPYKASTIGIHFTTNTSASWNYQVTNCLVDSVLIQRFEKGVYLDYPNSAHDTIMFSNVGFSNMHYGYHFNGYINATIINQRIENSDFLMKSERTRLVSLRDVYVYNTGFVDMSGGRLVVDGHLSILVQDSNVTTKQKANITGGSILLNCAFNMEGNFGVADNIANNSLFTIDGEGFNDFSILFNHVGKVYLNSNNNPVIRRTKTSERVIELQQMQAVATTLTQGYTTLSVERNAIGYKISNDVVNVTGGYNGQVIYIYSKDGERHNITVDGRVFVVDKYHTISIENVSGTWIYNKGESALFINTSRPSWITSDMAGFCMFDKSLTPARPIWWNGTDWIDATGATV